MSDGSASRPGRRGFPCRFLSVSSLLVLLVSSGIASAQSTPELKPEVGLQKSLSGGETQSFHVHVLKGQFLYVIVEQQGIDVQAVLLGPDGKEIAHCDSQNSAWGPEILVTIADVEGMYGVEVRSTSKDDPPGRYEIHIAALRDATAKDAEQVAAARDFQDGDDQSGLHTAASLAIAVADYEKALSFYHAAGDHYREALTLYSIGAAYAELRKFQDALASFGESLPLFHSLGDMRMEASTLNFIGGARDVLGDIREALKNYEQTLPLLRDAKNSATEASVLNNIGKIYGDLGEWQKSIDYYNQALQLFEALKSPGDEALCLHNIAVTYSLLGEHEEALQDFRKALPLRRAAEDKKGEAETLTEIGYTYSKLGDPQKAIEYYDQALPLRQEAEDRWGRARTLDYLGVAYTALQQAQKGQAFHQEALEIYKSIGDVRDEGVALHHLGNTYDVLGDPEKAIDYQNQALAIFKSVGDRDGSAATLQSLASIETHLGKLNAAQQHLEESLTLVEQVRAGAGSAEHRASYFATQQSAYELYIGLMMRLQQKYPGQGYDAKAFETSERARARSLLEMLSETHVDFREGVDPDLIRREHDLDSSINAKANRLLGLEGSATKEQAAELQEQIAELETQYQQLQAEIREKSPRYAALTQPQPLSLHDIQQTLDNDTALLEYALGSEHSYLWLVTPTDLKSYELPKKTEIESAVRKLYEQITARSTYPRGELPDQRQARITKADDDLPATAQALSGMVLGSAASDLSRKRLVIVEDGALQHVPFSMLPVAMNDHESAPLVAAHEIVGLPSASTIAVIRQQLRRPPAPRMLAVLADPVFNANDPRVKTKSAAAGSAHPVALHSGAEARVLEHLYENDPKLTAARMVIPRLPYTRQEAERILQVAPKGENFEALDFRANLETATSPDLGKYRYVHFATHGYLDSEHPELSAIVLSLVDRQGNSVPGFLRAGDLYNLKLPADLVVLSACQTGMGKEIRGEGIVGLTRGFMYAGAARVDVSLWSVNDKATERLMATFYEKLLKEEMTPSAALREAQVEMSRSKQWSNPFFWAAFVQQGEWR